MSVRLHREKECAEDGCPLPAHHADLCDAHYLAAAPEVKRTCDLLDRLGAPQDFVPFALYGVQCPEVKMGADAHRQATEIRDLEAAFNLDDDEHDTEAIDSEVIAKAVEFEALFFDVPAWGEAA